MTEKLTGRLSGFRGYSAYEIAVQEGFVGTVDCSVILVEEYIRKLCRVSHNLRSRGVIVIKVDSRFKIAEFDTVEFGNSP